MARSKQLNYVVACAALVILAVGCVVALDDSATQAPAIPAKEIAAPRPDTATPLVSNEIAAPRTEARRQTQPSRVRADTERARQDRTDRDQNRRPRRERVTEWKDADGNTLTKISQLSDEQYRQWYMQERMASRDIRRQMRDKKMDTNGDGTVSDEERQAAREASRAEMESRREEMESRRTQWQSMSEEERNAEMATRRTEMENRINEQRETMTKLYEESGYTLGGELTTEQRTEIEEQLSAHGGDDIGMGMGGRMGGRGGR